MTQFIAKMELQALKKAMQKYMPYFEALGIDSQFIYSCIDSQVVQFMIQKFVVNPTSLQQFFLKRIKKMKDLGFNLKQVFWLPRKFNSSADTLIHLNKQKDISVFLGQYDESTRNFKLDTPFFLGPET